MNDEFALIEESGYFDLEFYKVNYLSDTNDTHPIAHYLEIGWEEGFNPGGLFETSYYLSANPDVRAANMNPLVHYLMHGRLEGRFATADEQQQAGGVRKPKFYAPDRNNYQDWLRQYDVLGDEERIEMRRRIKSSPRSPLISVIMPVYNPPLDFLTQAIESVRNQIYENWELCIADDMSTNPGVRELLELYAKQDSRIRIIFRETNGHISKASNSAAQLASGEFFALLDNDDVLSEHALYWVVDAIISNPSVGIIYSDEDKIDEKGVRSQPYFKCDWNLYLARSHNMVCHLGVYRASLFNSLGGFRAGVEGAQDYDLMIRCAETLKPDQIIHIPRVLYHWRIHDESTALGGEVKPYALDAGTRVIDDHLSRQGIKGKAELLDFGMYRVHYEIPVDEPMVSMIIPTRNAHRLVQQCIDSITERTTYSNYEIILVDNGSDNPESLKYFADLDDRENVRVLRDARPFNYSALNNEAVKLARGMYVALVNNDVEVITPEWLTEMVSLASQPGAGAIGARLWYPDDKLQHGGVIIGIGGVAGHSHKFLPKCSKGYFFRDRLIQGFSAVTGACLLVRKEVYESVGGLDEDNLTVAFNDVDFCLRLREAGYQNIWTPYAELYHHESVSRGHEDTPEKQDRFVREVRYMQDRWGGDLLIDPAYSPNLTYAHEDFSLAWPPRVQQILDQLKD